MREAFQIAGALQLPAAHDRRKAQDLGARLAVARDEGRKARDHILENRCARINALDAGRQQQRLGKRIQRTIGLRVLGCHFHRSRLTVHLVFLLICRAPQRWIARLRPARPRHPPPAHTCSRSEAGAPLSKDAVPTLAMMRSLLIMIGDDNTSRRWRPTLNSPSLR